MAERDISNNSKNINLNILLSDYERIKQEKQSLENKNKLLADEIDTLTQQINFLEQRTTYEGKYRQQMQILSEDQKELNDTINNLQKEIKEKNKEKHLSDMSNEKLKNEIEFLQIEIKNLNDKENKYKKKISQLLSENSELQDEKEKISKDYRKLNEKFNEYEEKINNLSKKNEVLDSTIKSKDNFEVDYKNLLKEKNRELKNEEENNAILRKDIHVLNEKIQELVKENEEIKKNNKNYIQSNEQLNTELNELKTSFNDLQLEKDRIDKQNMYMNTELKNEKYKNELNEKKLFMSKCEILELDKTIKILKKNLERNKILSTQNFNNTMNSCCCTYMCNSNNNSNFLMGKCNLCGCAIDNNNENDNNKEEEDDEKNKNKYIVNYDGEKYDIRILVEDNKKLYKVNETLKFQINNLMKNLDVQIKRNNSEKNFGGNDNTN